MKIFIEVEREEIDTLRSLRVNGLSCVPLRALFDLFREGGWGIFNRPCPECAQFGISTTAFYHDEKGIKCIRCGYYPGGKGKAE